MKKYLSHILAVALVSLNASALEVNIRPGGLQSAVGSHIDAATLSVNGSLDASDFFFIRSYMHSLESLDLSSCTISAYNGTPIDGKISYPANCIPSGALTATRLSTVIFPSSGKITIGDFAFAGTALQDVSLPANITNVGQGAFSDCRALRAVNISSATQLGEYVFAACTSLESVDLGGINTIGLADFTDCTSLTSISGAEKLTSIGDKAFAACSSLELFPFPTSLKTIGDGAFLETGLVEIDLEFANSLRSIGAWAFDKCTKLTTVTLPAAVDYLGEGAFAGCTSLKSIVLPENCSRIPDYAFNSTPLSGDMTLPADSESIGEYALKNTGITTLVLPSSLTNIGTGAMEGTASLQMIDASRLDAVPELGEDVWRDVQQSGVILQVKDVHAEDFRNAAQWQEFTINATSTGSNLIATSASAIRGRIAAGVLYIESCSDISSVRVFDTAGRMIASAFPDDTECAIDLSSSDEHLFVVACCLADGTGASLKLAR